MQKRQAGRQGVRKEEELERKNTKDMKEGKAREGCACVYRGRTEGRKERRAEGRDG